MKTLSIDLPGREYPIYIGTNLLAQPGLVATHLESPPVLVVTNEHVAPLYLDRLRQGLGNIEQDVVILPDGEQYKTLNTLGPIFDRLLHRRFGRDASIIALGGGSWATWQGSQQPVISEASDSFKAPTTYSHKWTPLSAGKTGVNHPSGKNMIGGLPFSRAALLRTSVH